ncbi:oligopeptide/dipeptide ABC transporter ATP-binding protein [Halobellus sp. GM3]|uniref:oligopeptide/dipeptide ABC transporter ATP-binding protein n=1 Tax=Halobellus sp. GM3 TaxID=3458410 RepID=UPI00403DBD59
MSENTILSVEDLHVQFETDYGTVNAVGGVSFDVREGEIVGLVGESGAGKSVTVMSILRLLEGGGKMTGGEIRLRDQLLAGYDYGPDGRVEDSDMLTEAEMRRDVRGSKVAVIFQNPTDSLNPVYTVGSQIQEFISLNRDLTGEAARSEAVSMLRKVGIPEPEDRFDDYPHEFSGGMRQRVLIAMALGCQPDLIIADEPTTALDVTVEAQILDLVRDIQTEINTSFIWVTHDMGVVSEICDRVNVMYLGEIVEQGPVDEIFYETSHPYTQALLNSIPRPDQTVEEIEPIAGVMPSAVNPPSGCRFHTRCPDAKEICRRTSPDPVEMDHSDHVAACLKHSAERYEESEPLAPSGETIASSGGASAPSVEQQTGGADG